MTQQSKTTSTATVNTYAYKSFTICANGIEVRFNENGTISILKDFTEILECIELPYEDYESMVAFVDEVREEMRKQA